MIKNKKQSLTIEAIKAQSSIEREIKIYLDKCPTQSVRSIALTEWARELVRISRKLRHEDKEIKGWVKTYADKGNWHKRQILFVLSENGLTKPQYQDHSKTYHPIDLVKTFEKIIKKFSKMKDDDLIDCDYSPDRITENAENNLREWASRMNEGELRKNTKLTKALIALFKRGDELMQQRKQGIRQFKDGR